MQLDFFRQFFKTLVNPFATSKDRRDYSAFLYNITICERIFWGSYKLLGTCTSFEMPFLRLFVWDASSFIYNSPEFFGNSIVARIPLGFLHFARDYLFVLSLSKEIFFRFDWFRWDSCTFYIGRGLQAHLSSQNAAMRNRKTKLLNARSGKRCIKYRLIVHRKIPNLSLSSTTPLYHPPLSPLSLSFSLSLSLSLWFSDRYWPHSTFPINWVDTILRRPPLTCKHSLDSQNFHVSVNTPRKLFWFSNRSQSFSRCSR